MFSKHLKLRQDVLLLCAGGICLLFSQGRWPIPFAAFGYFILMLRFFRVSKTLVAFLGFLVVHTIAWDIAYTGLIPIPLPWRFIISILFTCIIGLIFFIDRIVSSKSKAFYTTLIFPCGFVFLEFLVGGYSTGTGSSISNTFSNELVFAQLASITGWTGITFCVTWVASVVNYFWDSCSFNKPAYRSLLYCGMIMMLISIFGQVRLWMPYSEGTVKVASIVGESTLPKTGDLREHVLGYLTGKPLVEDNHKEARNHVRKILDRNFQLAEQEFNAGAQMVIFPEGNPAITSYEEQYCLEYAKSLATKNRSYFGLGFYIFQHEEAMENENKFIFISPDGTIIWEYFKSKLVPGSEHKVGDGILPVHNSEFGKLSAAICYDMDFPRLMLQAGQQNTDILFGPSNDWPEFSEIHVRMARLRSIELGFSLVRPTGNGYSYATDPYGRFIAFQSTTLPGEHIMIADVFTKGVNTIYSRIGNLFSWICIAVFFIFCPITLLRNRKTLR